MKLLTNCATHCSAARWVVSARGELMMIVVAAGLLAGCSKASPTASAVTGDPQLDARLNQLTHELHRTMVGRKLNRDFDEFVALRKLDVSPPPEGKKYAINEKWRVVIVDK